MCESMICLLSRSVDWVTFSQIIGAYELILHSIVCENFFVLSLQLESSLIKDFPRCEKLQ